MSRILVMPLRPDRRIGSHRRISVNVVNVIGIEEIGGRDAIAKVLIEIESYAVSFFAIVYHA